jgi:hypothetical protein
MSKNLVITVTKAHGVILPAVAPPDQNEPGNFKAETITELAEEQAGLMLLPGQNSVTPGYWDWCKKNPGVKIWLKADIVRNDGTGVAVPLATDFDSLTLARAKEFIGKINDVGALNRIKDDTKKKKLIDICNKRIDEVLAENEKKNG